MTPQDLLTYNIKLTHSVTREYLKDISDEEMLVRPLPGVNHLAWQLGHLIASEHEMLTAIAPPGCSPPPLPEGFAEAHSKEAATADDPSQFRSKDEYLTLMRSLHDAAVAMIEQIPAERLDEPGPEKMRSYLPTVGSVLLMVGAHEMMHTGQFATIRRKLGKPVVI